MQEIFVIYGFDTDAVVSVKNTRKDAVDYILNENNPLLFYFIRAWQVTPGKLVDKTK